jgi:hypothetical protein
MRVLLAGVIVVAGIAMDAKASTRVAWTTPTLLGVDDAIQRLNAYLLEQQEDAGAYFTLGTIHGLVYALGCDAVAVEVPEGENTAIHLRDQGLPPQRMAKRLESLPPDRALHLVKAVTALHRAAALDSENSKYTLALGYLYHECRDRFGEGDWPLEATAFDTEAKELGNRPAFWEERALSALRRIAPEGTPETEFVVKYNFTLQESETYLSILASSIIVEILSRRETLTPEEFEELERMNVVMKMAKIYVPRKPMGERELPPLPIELAAIYPSSSDGLATAELYFRALDASLCHRVGDIPIIGARAEMPEGKSLTEEDMTQIGAYLGYHRETLRLLAQAAQSPECRYPVDLTQGTRVELEHVPPLRLLAYLLVLRALHAAETGDADVAGQAILECISLAESLRNEPLLISQLVRTTIHGIAIDMLQEVMNRVALSAVAMDRIQRALSTADNPESLQYAIKGEAFGMIKEIRDPPPPPDYSEYPPEMVADMQKSQPPVILEADLRAMYDRIAAAAALPFGEAIPALEEATMSGPIMVPALSRAYTAFVRHSAALRNAQGALAVERYWAAHGHAPESLHDLVPIYTPTLLIDPFDGEPLRFRAEEGGYIVYSVADNLTDDNGEKGDTRPALDITFKVGIETETDGDAEGDEI